MLYFFVVECRNKKLVLKWEEVGYILFSSPVFLLLLCFVLLFSFFFSINSESHNPLSSLVEIHQEIQKYLWDADWCTNKAVKTAEENEAKTKDNN